jgi:hypothetical protein
MGLTPPNQPPTIQWPAVGATDVPLDASLWGVGGALVPPPSGPPYPLPSTLQLRVDGRVVDAGWEVVGSFTTGPTPHGMESRAVVRIRPAHAFDPEADVRLVEAHPGAPERVLASFRTGMRPSPLAELSPARLRADHPSLQRPLPPAPPGPSEPSVVVGLELAPGPYLVDMGSSTVLAIGPGPFVASAPQGAVVRVRDAELRERLTFTAS